MAELLDYEGSNPSRSATDSRSLATHPLKLLKWGAFIRAPSTRASEFRSVCVPVPRSRPHFARKRPNDA
jgi:hypothetical protein